MKTVWNQINTTYFPSEPAVQVDKIPVGIYKIAFSDIHGPYVSLVANKFEFPYKIYGMEKDFINRVVRTWKETTGNLGILLNGLKGTGKTVTAELICNNMNLPVLLITSPHPSFISFLAELKQEVVVLIDEFEKVYREKDETFLSLMDGVLNGSHRKMFLLTTNSLSIDKNLIQRPSRIRYIKTLEDMTLPIIMEVVNDQLKHKELFDATVDFISNLEIITMDLVKSVIQEVNIHAEDPANFKDIFNVHGEKESLYNVFEIVEGGKKEKIMTMVPISPSYFSTTQYMAGYNVHAGRTYLGEIMEVINDNTLKVKRNVEIDVVVKNEEGEEEYDTQIKTEIKTYTFEKTIAKHKSFKSYYDYAY